MDQRGCRVDAIYYLEEAVSDHGDAPDTTDVDHDSSSSDCSGSSDSIGVQCVVSDGGKMGCGEWNKSSHDVCTFCDNRLLSVDTDAFGRRLHLGQRIFFYRSGRNSFLEEGTVVHLSDCSTYSKDNVKKDENGNDRNVTVKYLKNYCADSYDEKRSHCEVLINAEMAESGKGRRPRRPLVIESKKVKPQLILSSSSSTSSASSYSSSSYSTSPSTSSYSSSSTSMVAASISVKRSADLTEQRSAEKKSRNTLDPDVSTQPCVSKAKSGKKKKEKSEKVSKAGKMEEVEEVEEVEVTSNCSSRFTDYQVHDLAALLFPSISREVSSVRGVDRQIKRGLLHALYQHLNPPTQHRSSRRSSERVLLTVDQLAELLHVCPTSMEQMRNIELMPLCAVLSDSPPSDNPPVRQTIIAQPSDTLSSCDTVNIAKTAEMVDSLGEELVVVIRRYLLERGFNVNALSAHERLPGLDSAHTARGEGRGDGRVDGRGGRVRGGDDDETESLPRGLSIPLSYDHFNIALDLAFERLNGREAFENARGVRGLDFYIDDSSRASASSSSSSQATGENGENGGKGKGGKGKGAKGAKLDAMYGSMSTIFIEESVVQASRIGISDDFLDLGSGIGQIVLQVAATVGCKAIGMELTPLRHEAAEKLLAALEAVLEEAGIVTDDAHPSLRSLVDLRHMNFISPEGGRIVKAAKIIFFNNFGHWFSDVMPAFTDQLKSKTGKGSQVITVNDLVQASQWLHVTNSQSGTGACSWSNNDFPVFHYTQLTDDPMWTCKKCSLTNFVGMNDCTACGSKPFSHRLGVCTSGR